MPRSSGANARQQTTSRRSCSPSTKRSARSWPTLSCGPCAIPLCRRGGVSYDDHLSFAKACCVAHRNVQESLRVSWVEIDRMTAAAAIIREIGRELVGHNLSIVSEVLAGHATISDWRHYPEEDVYDSRSHAQYFYHTHPMKRRAGREHGHFHTFLR